MWRHFTLSITTNQLIVKFFETLKILCVSNIHVILLTYILMTLVNLTKLIGGILTEVMTAIIVTAYLCTMTTMIWQWWLLAVQIHAEMPKKVCTSNFWITGFNQFSVTRSKKNLSLVLNLRVAIMRLWCRCVLLSC